MRMVKPDRQVLEVIKLGKHTRRSFVQVPQGNFQIPQSRLVLSQNPLHLQILHVHDAFFILRALPG